MRVNLGDTMAEKIAGLVILVGLVIVVAALIFGTSDAELCEEKGGTMEFSHTQQSVSIIGKVIIPRTDSVYVCR